MDCLHIGTPPPEFMESKLIYVHDYLKLSHIRSNANFVTSPRFWCFGHEWELRVYPGGDEESDGSDTRGSIHLRHCSCGEIEIEWSVMLMQDGGERFISVDSADAPLNMIFDGPDHSQRFGYITDREEIVEDPATHLECESSLGIKVWMMQSSRKRNCVVPQCQPAYDNMEVFLDDETSDIAFQVKGRNVVAHKSIIKAHAKDFFVMCEGSTVESPMLINDVNPDVFEMMLHSLYGGFIPPNEWQRNSESILDAACKYGFNRLKSEAEVWYLKYVEFTVDNVIDVFLKADGNNCAILREAAKEHMAENGAEVVASESFVKLHESLPLMREVMTAALDKKVESNKRKRLASRE
eukprot:scaffold49508_cov47-Cyclotella_meneghiniana.AAC.7